VACSAPVSTIDNVARQMAIASQYSEADFLQGKTETKICTNKKMIVFKAFRK
jgi:hypothetical protein